MTGTVPVLINRLVAVRPHRLAEGKQPNSDGIRQPNLFNMAHFSVLSLCYRGEAEPLSLSSRNS